MSVGASGSALSTVVSNLNVMACAWSLLLPTQAKQLPQPAAPRDAATASKTPSLARPPRERLLPSQPPAQLSIQPVATDLYRNRGPPPREGETMAMRLSTLERAMHQPADAPGLVHASFLEPLSPCFASEKVPVSRVLDRAQAASALPAATGWCW